MRRNIHKKNSTKAERIFHEILKRNHIPFKHRVKIKGREVDFLIDNIAVEIGDHSQDPAKNKGIIESGLHLLHISNQDLYNRRESVEKHFLKNWKNG